MHANEGTGALANMKASRQRRPVLNANSEMMAHAQQLEQSEYFAQKLPDSRNQEEGAMIELAHRKLVLSQSDLSVSDF